MIIGPTLIITLIFGAISGWIASAIAGGGGGFIRNTLVGLIGAVIGHFLLTYFGVHFAGPWVHALVSAVIGGVIVIFVGRFLGG